MRGSSRHRPSRPDAKVGRVTDTQGGHRAGRRRVQPGSGAAARDRQPAGRPPATHPGSVDSGRLAGLLRPAVEAGGMDLESVRVATVGRRLLLRVVVDADGGVALDDIADISREIAAALDADTVMGETPYTLEVSSPGVERPLTEPRHWRRAAGRLVDAPLASGKDPLGGHGAPGRPGRIRGRVIGANDDGVTLEVDGARHTFTYHELGPGTVQVEFGRMAEEAGPDGGKPDGH